MTKKNKALRPIANADLKSVTGGSPTLPLPPPSPKPEGGPGSDLPRGGW